MPKLFQSINIAPHKVRAAVAKMEVKTGLQHVLETCPDCRAIREFGANSIELCVYAQRSALEIRGWLMGHANMHLNKDRVRLPAEMVLTKNLSKPELIGKQKLIDCLNGKFRHADIPTNPAQDQMRARTGDNLRWYSEMSKEKLLTKFTLEDFQKLAGEMLLAIGNGVEQELRK